MNDFPESELISAYLDGELTAAERTQVEQLLAANPATRQWMEDLRAVGAAIKSLPQQRLDEDLSGRVLKIAERRVLTGGDNLARPADAGDRRWWRQVDWRGMASKRALFWSGLAMAIAVMIRLNEPPQPAQAPGRQVAVAPKPADAPRAPEVPAPAGPPPTIQAQGWKDVTDRDKKESLAAKEQGQATKGPGQVAVEPRRAAKSQPPVQQDELLAANSPNLLQQDAVKKVPEALQAPVAGSQLQSSAPAGQQQAGVDRERATQATTPLVAASPAAAPPAPGLAGVARQLGGGNGQPAMSEKAGSPARGEVAKAAAPATAGETFGAMEFRYSQAAGQATEVRVDISPEAARNHAFEQLLASNGLGAQNRARQPDGAENEQTRGSAPGDQPGGRAAGAAEAFKGGKAAVGGSLRLATPQSLVYEVRATPAQLQSLIAQLGRKPESFSSVSVQTPSDQLKQALASDGRDSDKQLFAQSSPHRTLRIQSRARPPLPGKAEVAPHDEAASAAPASAADGMPASGPAEAQKRKDSLRKATADGQEKAAEDKPSKPQTVAAERVVFVLRVIDRGPPAAPAAAAKK